jgi:hypothetical protein
MADYVTLGARPVQAAADNTQRNAGNYTNYFSGAELSVNVPYFEIYHILFTGARVLDNVTIWIGSAQWSFASAGPGGGAEWDPVSPMLLRPGDEVYFFWNTPDTVATGPLVTCWLRFDVSIPANKHYAGSQ